MDKFIFSADQIKNYSKFLDNLINWKKVLNKNYHFLGIFSINVGKIVEKYDDEAYSNIFKLVNQLYADGKISDSIADLLKDIFKAWDDASQEEFIDILTKEIAGKVNILDNDTQETAFIKSALLMVSTLKPDLISSLHESYNKVLADSID